MTRWTVPITSGFLLLVMSILFPLDAQAQNSGYIRRYAANFAVKSWQTSRRADEV